MLTAKGIFSIAALAVISNLVVAADLPYSKSFVDGMISGCIDAQRRLHAESGLKFDALMVSNYCNCKTGTMVEIFGEKRIKEYIVSRDAKTDAAIKKIDANCAVAAREGKRFGPTAKETGVVDQAIQFGAEQSDSQLLTHGQL